MEKNILLIHGGPGFDDSYFYPYMEFLSSNASIFSYKLGFSVVDYTLDNLVSELEEKIKTFRKEKLIVFAHSFAALLCLNLNAEYINRVDKFIFSNWIYDTKWIDEFYVNHPNLPDTRNKNLKESTLLLKDFYFMNSKLGEIALENIEYNDEMQSQINQIYNDKFDLSYNLKDFAAKLISIRSDKDRITTSKYIERITSKFRIQDYVIPRSGHFPFIDNNDHFKKLMIDILETEVS